MSFLEGLIRCGKARKHSFALCQPAFIELLVSLGSLRAVSIGKLRPVSTRTSSITSSQPSCRALPQQKLPSSFRNTHSCGKSILHQSRMPTTKRLKYTIRTNHPHSMWLSSSIYPARTPLLFRLPLWPSAKMFMLFAKNMRPKSPASIAQAKTPSNSK